MSGAVVETPIGPVLVEADEVGVRTVRLAADPPPALVGVLPTGVLATAVAQLREYFAGERTDFALPLAIPAGRGSGFERAVWSELTRIPYGEQRTYGEVAAALGDVGAARAVGTACNRNPVPLLVPCHRVVGAGGRLVGFGAGLPRKQWLLEHEARVSWQRDWS